MNADETDRRRRRSRNRWLLFIVSFLPLIPAALFFDYKEWPGLSILFLMVAVMLPVSVAVAAWQRLVESVQAAGYLDSRLAAPAPGHEVIVTWTHAGVQHHLEPAGLTVDSRLVAPASDGFDSVRLEIQQHPSTGDQLHLVAATLRPRVEIRWQGTLPPDEQGLVVASLLLLEPRVRDETRERRLKPYSETGGDS